MQTPATQVQLHTKVVTRGHSVTREFLCPLNAFTLKSLLAGRHLPVPSEGHAGGAVLSRPLFTRADPACGAYGNASTLFPVLFSHGGHITNRIIPPA